MERFRLGALAVGAPGLLLTLVFIIGIAVGTALGAGNALLAAGLRIPAIVATLGTLAIYRGGIIVYAGGRQISATVLPDRYGAVAQTHILGQSPLVWIALALTLVLGWLARNTRTGRNVYAIGSNPRGPNFPASASGGMWPFSSFSPGCFAG